MPAVIAKGVHVLIALILLLISVTCIVAGWVLRQQRADFGNVLWSAAAATLGLSFLLRHSWVGVLFVGLAIEQLVRAYKNAPPSASDPTNYNK
jgi:heme/copper-type cytochrome/quinol oxidase subunit 3